MARAITPYYRSEYRTDSRRPEVVNPRIADIEAMARWLDYAFVLPGGFRFGLAGIIGMIPGVGDLFDALLSLYIVGRAVQLGIPRVTLARMVLNVGIETAAGMVPFLGAVFDTVFKANRRNYQLLKGHVLGTRNGTANDWLFLMVSAVAILGVLSIPIIVLIELLKHF